MKTVIKTIFSAFALSLFLVSTSFAQSTGTVQDAQSDDTYTQDGTYQNTQDGTQGTMQDNTYEQQQDDRYTTQDGMESQDYGNQNQDQLGQTGEQDRTQIAREELPSNVSEAIEEGEYADWSVAEAYEVNDQEETLYEIHFENEQGQTEQERFRQNGEVAR